MNKRSRLSRVSSAATIAVILITGYFFFRTLTGSWDRVRSYDYIPNWQIIPALILLASSVMLTGLVWRLVLRRLSGGKAISPAYAIKTHNTAWLLKYLPGQGGLVLGKITMLHRIGFTKKEILVSIIYENVYLVAASVLTSLPFIVGSMGNLSSLYLIVLLAVGLVIVASPPVFYQILNFVLRKIKREPIERSFFLSFTELVRYMVLFLLPRITNGIGFVFLIAAYTSVEPAHYLGIGASFIIASIVGMLAFLVPGGIGVREGVLSLLLANYYPVEIAVMLSLVARLVVVIGDGILFAINLFIKE